jgi:uncharacterized membrane protein YhiD involved in acid resistance
VIGMPFGTGVVASVGVAVGGGVAELVAVGVGAVLAIVVGVAPLLQALPARSRQPAEQHRWRTVP